MKLRRVSAHAPRLSDGARQALLARYDERLRPGVWRAPAGIRLTAEVGSDPLNQDRNRYLQVVPWDHNRAVLRGSVYQNNDYVNASWIHIPHGQERWPGPHLAAQGPLPETVPHFWAALAEAGVGVLVQVTDWEQGGRIKCHPYLPAGEGALRAGEVQVEVGPVEPRVRVEGAGATPQLVRRAAALRWEGPLRQLEHWHYEGWPDHGAPELALLWALAEEVSEASTRLGAPMAVHCSAGIGRTGTLFAALALMALRDAGGAVDQGALDAIIDALRIQRMWMVESAEQYLGLSELVAWLEDEGR